MIFIAAFIGGLVQGAVLKDMLEVFAETLKKYWKTILTICAVMATAKIMSYSGMISDIAEFLVAAAGPFYPFIAPLIGKMICPQGIAIGAGAINAVGSESKILSAVFKYFLIYVILADVICYVGSMMGF